MLNLTGGNALVDINLILEKARIRENLKTADLGCGASGHIIFPVANRIGKKGKVYAVDILKTVLENTNKQIRLNNYENIETVWSNLEKFGATKIESGSLDVAFLVNTLYQSHKRADILRESFRLLKKNGRLVIVEWKNIASPFGPLAEERVNKDLLIKAGEKLGGVLEEEFEAGQYHFGMVFVKL